MFGLFKKKTKKQTILFKDLLSWIENYNIVISLGETVASYQQKIEKLIGQTNVSLVRLESTDLMNNKIPVREKDIMHGNRQAYIRKVRAFFDNIEDIPEDYHGIKRFNNNFFDRLNTFANESQKNFFVLQNFLRDETTKIAKNINSMKELVVELNEWMKEKGYHHIEKAKELLQEIEENKITIGELTNEKRELSADLRTLAEKEEKQEKKLKKRKNSPHVDRYQDMIKEKEKIEKQLKKEISSVQSAFSDITKPLKKYDHDHDEEVIEYYLINPATALEFDTKFKIVNILKKMDLKKYENNEKKRKTTKEKIKKITKDFLSKKEKTIRKTKEELSTIQRRIRNDTTSLSIGEAEKHVSLVKEEIERANTRLVEIDKQIKKLDVKIIKKAIVDELKDMVNIQNGR